jgi:hypothetical protein
MERVSSSQAIDIMVPPQFYTMRRQNIDIKYHYQAKRVAPSVLESYLSEDIEYEYFVYRDDKDWVFIAYETIEIDDFLKSHNIAVDQISKLYFAQQSSDKFLLPLSLNENEALMTVDGVVTVVPKTLLDYPIRYQLFDNSFRPKDSISYGVGANSIIEKRDAWSLAAIFILFASIFVVEGIRYNSVVTDMKREISMLFADYPSLQSNYTRDNVIKKYKKIDRDERRKREILKELSRMILPSVEVEHLLVDRGSIVVTFRVPNRQTLLKIESIARAKKYKTKRVGRENLINVEGSI